MRAQHASLLEHACSAALDVHVVTVAAAIARDELGHAGLGEDLRAALLRQIEVVLVERVLRAVAAAAHAAATADASGALGTIAAEERIRVLLAGAIAEVHGDVGRGGRGAGARARRRRRRRAGGGAGGL